MILELLSHQNYADMLVAHDPNLKFVMARAIYKSILAYSASIHQKPQPVVQPLPVRNITAIANKEAKNITLSWTPQADPLEPTATPLSYIIYIKQDDRGWDNGTVIKGTMANINAKPGVLYRFRVAALNEGGSSLKSEEVCARIPFNKNAPEVIIVNGFERLAAPQAVDVDTLRGFDIKQDPGVAYMQNTSLYELNGMPVAGNEQVAGILHGGAHLVLAETLGSFGAALHAGPGRQALGIEIGATHHRAIASGTVTGTATAVHLGGTLVTHEVVMTDEEGRRLSTARITNMIRDAR
jgi:uncharacterized protein (TIGR00369 family)